MRQKIYITRKLPNEVFEKMQKYFDVKMWHEEDVPVPREILEKEITEIDGLYCLLTEKVDRALLDRATNLKVVSNMAVGYDNIDVTAATEKQIMVTNTPGVLTETTADLTFALLMATARRLVEATHYLKEGKWKTWSPFQLTGQDVYGATIGIIGLGRIGEAVARRAKAFHMEILYYSRNRKSKVEQELGVTYTDKDSLLKQSDFVVILTPFAAETKNLIGERELRLMKETAILINTSRGGIVNETALYDALVEGEIYAAGLDVFAEEPVPLHHPLLTLDNVIALPHIGSASKKTRMRMAHMAAEQLIQALHRAKPDHLVNEEVWEN